MANVANAFDFNDTLATFLAGAISGGTYDDIITTLKFDVVGEEVVATGIDAAAGQLWSNLLDDYIHATYPSFYRATKTWRVATVALRNALGSDDGLAVGDLGYTDDTNALSTVVSVDGVSSSTWKSIFIGFGITSATPTYLAGGGAYNDGTSAVGNNPGGVSDHRSTMGSATGLETVSWNLVVEDGSRNTRVKTFLTDGVAGAGAFGLWLTFSSSGAQPFVIGAAGDEWLRIHTDGAFEPQAAIVNNAIITDTLGANENNYDPGGIWPAVNTLRLTPNGGGTTLNGVDATDVRDGQTIILINPSSADDLTILDESGASLAANRFRVDGFTFVINPQAMVVMRYDGVSSRWRITG